MHHDSSKESNVGMMIQYLKKKSPEYTFSYITKQDANSIKGKGLLKNFIPFFIGKSYQLATSEYILQDDVFLPLSYLRFRKRVKDIQLWHGTGSIKKFGQDANTGRLKELERRANRNITHLIVNSSKMTELYAKAFGIEQGKVFAYGLPRTDTLFQIKDQRSNRMDAGIEKFYAEFPELIKKRILLYAPTFRDDETENPKVELDIEKLLDGLSEEYVLIVKLHPFVADAFTLKEGHAQNRLFHLSAYQDLNTLMNVSEILITDYSSIVYEYCLQEKPMIFYAYDLQKFSDSGRGFYQSYENYVPGPAVQTTEEIIDLIVRNQFDLDRINQFKKAHYDYTDGKSTERVAENIFK